MGGNECRKSVQKEEKASAEVNIYGRRIDAKIQVAEARALC